MIILSSGERHEIGKPFIPDIQAIAFALSNINRFTGHVGGYSVAQHCCLVSDHLPDNLRLSGLLHDAPEAYIGDISAPLKRHIPDYKKLETFYHSVIDSYYRVDTENPGVKEIDIRALVTEASAFGLCSSAFPDVEPLTSRLRKWSAEEARIEFLSRFERLVRLRSVRDSK